MCFKMRIQICPLRFALSEMFAFISHSGTITLADRYGLLAFILDDSLTEEERRSVDRILRSVYKGRTQVIDEISALAQFN